MIIIQPSLQLAPTLGNPLATPVIGYKNLVTATNVSALTAAAGHPASNVANPQTFNYWEGVEGSPVADHYLTLQVNADDPIDYVGIAGHNLGLAQCAVSIEAYNGSIGSPALPDWQEIIAPIMPGDNTPLLMRWDPQAYIGVRIRIQPGTEAPRVAVVHCGKLTVFEVGTHTKHVPINFGRRKFIQSNRSETGQFLGRIQTGKLNETTFQVRALSPAFVANELDPFLELAPPFFWAWAPADFPTHVGYCWLMNDPHPEYDWEIRRFECAFTMQGLAL